MAAFLVVILVLGGVAYLFQRNIQRTATGFNRIMQDMLAISQLVQRVDELNQFLQELGGLPSAEMQAPYSQAKQAVIGARATLPLRVADPENAILVVNLRGMTESFVAEADQAVQASGMRSLASISHAAEADRIAGYIREVANRLMSAELTAYSRAYLPLSQRLQRVNQIAALLLAAIVLLVIGFVAWFARSLNRGLGALVRASNRIARGDLAPISLPGPTHPEVESLAGAMDSMLGALRHSIETEQLLRGAELRALQAQMDPHFLFNALNMVASTALLEGADKTCTLIEDIADLLRYNLRKLDEPASLRDEVEHAQRYLAVQAARFPGRLHYRVEVDDLALDLPVPALCLQPLVENSLVHGLGDREEGGRISLEVAAAGDRVTVLVTDDGVGMAPEQLERLRAGVAGPPPSPRSRSAGIGLRSLAQRLELFYGQPGLLTIEADPGAGTRVRLTLPNPAKRSYPRA